MSDLIRHLYSVTGHMLEKEMGTKAVLIDPDGRVYSKSAVDEKGEPYDETIPEEERRALLCAVFREHMDIDVRTGFDNVVDRPVVSFWLPSLSRVPIAGERWLVKIPKSPLDDTLEAWTFSEPPKGGKTVGFINLRLRKVTQN